LFKTKSHRPWALWLALLLTVFAALAPTVSHALHWARGDNAAMLEICTSAGPRWMALPATPQADGAPTTNSAALTNALDAALPGTGMPVSAKALDHCPFCLLQAERAAPLPQTRPQLFASPGKLAPPKTAQAGFLPPYFSHTPPSRGPPTLLSY
jgi:hypothetical protein